MSADGRRRAPIAPARPPRRLAPRAGELARGPGPRGGLATGIDGVEFDVRLSRDGVPVLLHDETLARVQGRDEAVCRPHGRELRGAGIPSLAEVLAARCPRTRSSTSSSRATATATPRPTCCGPAAARRRSAPSISSFDTDDAGGDGRAPARWPRWLNADGPRPETLSTGDRPRLPRRRRPVGRDHAGVAQGGARGRARGRRVDGHAAADGRAAGRARASSPAASRGPRSMARLGLGRSRRATSRATILPEQGGRVGSLVIGGHELLVTGHEDPMRWGSYPMAPFAGRIRDGRFSFRGRRPPAARWAMPPHAIHGVVYDRPWRIVDDRRRSPSTSTSAGRSAAGSSSGSRSTEDVDVVRADARGRRADAGHDRLAPVVPARARARRRAGRARRSPPTRCSSATPRACPAGESRRRRRRRPGTTRSPASTRDPVLTWPGRAAPRARRRAARGGSCTRRPSTRSASSPRAGRPTRSTGARGRASPARP